MQQKISTKKRILKHLGKVVTTLVGVALLPSISSANDSAETANQVLGNEGGKEALNTALKVAKGKPALSVATAIVCLACAPVSGVAASPALCISCGILLAKVLG